jgi:3-oxoacyl-ACP reductase-like protein
MSIFGKIAAAIFGTGEAKAADTPAPAGTAPTGAKAAAPAAAGGKPVDVSAVLNKLAENSKEDLDWRKSIVDLMKLLDLDSSLKARKALAAELNYTGSKSDTAGMNIWLHKQVMTKLAENGGVVPAELRD